MGIILGFVCIVLIIIGLVNYFFYKVKERKYYKAIGIIVDCEIIETKGIRRGGITSIYYYPIVEYKDKSGQTIQIVSDDGNPHSPVYPVGTVINLLVNPDDNTRILFDTETDKRWVPLICISTGGIALIMMICFYIFSQFIHPIHPKNPVLEILTNDSTFNQLPQDVKDSISSIIKNHQ